MNRVERVARHLCGLYYGGLTGPGNALNDKWKLYTDDAGSLIEIAFQVTDEDADIFFGRGKEKAGTEFVNHGWLRDFKTGMQALSDAALGKGS